MSRLLRALAALIAPTLCPACDRPRCEGAALLCERCASGLVRLSRVGPALTALAYEGTGAVLVRRLKFEGRRDGIPLLVEPLAERVGALRLDGIVPVPRHWRRVRDEGCDPAHDLARALSRATGHPVLSRVLSRSRHVPPQTGLSPAERRRSPEGSFRARPGALRRATVLLLDDVVTTGATLAAAARELRVTGGARRVLRAAATGTPSAAAL